MGDLFQPMFDCIIKELWQRFHQVVRVVMQRLKLFWHEEILRIDILRVKLCDPLDDIALLLQKELIFLLSFSLTLVLCYNELFDEF